MRGHDFGTWPLHELVKLYRQHGVQAVQLAVPKAVSGVESYFDVDEALTKALAAQLSAANVTVPVLGCYIEPALEDEEERNRQAELFMRAAECAAALNAGCVGTETTVCASETQRGQAFGRLCKSLETILKKADRLNVNVAVEPVARHTLNSPRLAYSLLREFGGTKLAFIFDPVNLLTPGLGSGQQALWREWLDVLGGKLMALHVKDAREDGGVFAACPLGEGVMDYSTVIAPFLRKNKPDMALLREETSLQTVERDFSWMSEIFLPQARA